jgi:3-methyladenine DNA glycosylase AlkD
MTLKEVMAELEKMGNANTKKVLLKHGAREPFFGVKIADLNKIVKKIKKDHSLALALYQTANSDAMYLAGLIADETKITKEELQTWADKAYWYMLSDYTVAWIAAESAHGWELANDWLNSEKELVASAGWSTLSNWVALYPDNELDMEALSKMLDRIQKEIHTAPNRVRYAMNGFVIAVGGSVASFLEKSKMVARRIGKVEVEMGGTACKVPVAEQYLEKMEGLGRIGKKKKVARC